MLSGRDLSLSRVCFVYSRSGFLVDFKSTCRTNIVFDSVMDWAAALSAVYVESESVSLQPISFILIKGKSFACDVPGTFKSVYFSGNSG